MRLYVDDHNGFKLLKDSAKKLTDNIGKVADDAVAVTAAKGRKEATRIEKTHFQMGDGINHYKSYKTKSGAYEKIISRVKYDSSLGGYVTNGSRQVQQHRMMNFSFESVANRRTQARKFAHVSFTSKLANLWENSTKTYSGNSPWFRRTGQTRSYRIKEGNIRQGERYFYTDVHSGMRKVLPVAMAETEKRLMDRLKETGFFAGKGKTI